MADVGDQIVVTSKGQPRLGVVTAVGRAMITVRWDTGAETSIVPGPGVFSVVPTSARTNRVEKPEDSAGRDKKKSAKKKDRNKDKNKDKNEKGKKKK